MAKKSGSQTSAKSTKPQRKPARKGVVANKESSQTKLPAVTEDTSSTGDGSSNECVVVGIGASAGGLEAFKTFLDALPANAGMAFVLIQHLDPDHESLMADLLSKYTAMPVVQVQDATAIKPNHVYMIPPNKFLKMHDGGLFLDKPVKQRGMRMPIDYFFRSLAKHRRERSIAIILSGTGSDGTLGLKEVKALGGMVMAQDPESADYDGMPRSAVSTGMVDFVLPIDDMPRALLRYARHPYLKHGADGEQTILETAPDHYRAIIKLLRAHTDYDFRCYKRGTLSRRIQRRMGLRHVEKIADYLGLLRKDRDELGRLFKDLLISVTAFFREKDAWATLEDEVVIKLIAKKKFDQPVRVWVPGCATGEEAYSIAMLLYEQFEVQNKNLDIQIFATDLDEDAIETARQGVYPASIAADVSPARLKRFFQDEGDHYRVNKRLREASVFAVQNVIGDPPFSNLDLVSCRNLMIYLEPHVQQKMVQMFSFALREGGVLFLGTSESVGKHSKLFEPISKQWRIYRKIGSARRGAANFPIIPAAERAEACATVDVEFGDQPFRSVELARKVLLEKFAPASVLINRKYEVQYFQGPVRNYLNIPSGEPTTDLTALCLEGLRSKLRGLIHKGLHESKPASVTAPRVRRDGRTVSVKISVEPLPHRRGGETLLLVSFEDEAPEATRIRPDQTNRVSSGATDPIAEHDAGKSGELVQQLEYELQATREDLQSTIEELETSNEELKASNEEVMSMNEELQSTNEELETSREELQSLNEELSTVNNQLEEKVHELENTNNDLTNLLTSTEIATIFLDTQFRIRRYTPAATDLVNVIDGDVGRPISDLAPRFNDPNLYRDARAVLQKLTPIEREVCVNVDQAAEQDREANAYADSRQPGGHIERWFIRRILPYRTRENRIDGVVVTYTDVSRLKNATQRLMQRELQSAMVAQLGHSALTGKSFDWLLDHAVKQVCETLDAEFCKVLRLAPDQKMMHLVAGVGWKEGLVGTTTVGAGLQSQAGYTLQRGGPVIVEDLAEEKRFAGPPLLTEHGVVSGVSVVIGPQERPWGVLGVHSARAGHFSIDDAHFVQAVAYLLWDAFEREHREASLRDSEQRLRLAAEAANFGTYDADLTTGEVYWSSETKKIMGLAEDAPVTVKAGEIPEERIHPDDRARVAEAVRQSLDPQGEGVINDEHRIVRPDGEIRWVQVRGRTIISGEGNQRRALRAAGTIIDITPRKSAEQKLQKLNETLEQRVEERAGLITLLHDITTACHHAETVDEAVAFVLREFSRFNGWCFGHAFRPADDNPDELTPFQVCYEETPGRFQQFRRRTISLRFAKGEGLPGRVFATGKPEFVNENLIKMVSERREALAACEISSAAVFPILVGDQVVAVLEFFSDQLHEAYDGVVEAMESIGSQLGRVVERMRLQREIAEASAQEQQRIGNELHDTVIQLLTGGQMMAEGLRQKLSEKRDLEESEVSNLVEALGDAQKQVRLIHHGLMPVEIDAAGLMNALEQLAVQTTSLHKVDCVFECRENVYIQNNTMATYLFRIAQEAVHNALKHAQPRLITIGLHNGNEIVLSVRDDGDGMPDEPKRIEGSGLRIMRYRAEVIGGKFTVQSTAGKGTTVLCKVAK